MGLFRSATVVAGVLMLHAGVAQATALSTWTWTGTVAAGAVSGTAIFSVVTDGAGFDLVVNLQNTATTAPATTAQVLTGLYFDVSNAPGALTLKSAVADLGILSAVNQTTVDNGTAGTNICAPGNGGTAPASSCSTKIAGGWEAAYSTNGLNNGTYTEQYGIGTSGQSGVFSGNPSNAGNANYGISPGNGVGSGSGGGIVGMLPYVYGSASFTLTGLTSSSVVISNVSGAYGTLPEGTPGAQSGTAVPEPASMMLLLVPVLALIGKRAGDGTLQRRTIGSSGP